MQLGNTRINNYKSLNILDRKAFETPMVHHYSDGTGRD
jgi:hypothetical protein